LFKTQNQKVYKLVDIQLPTSCRETGYYIVLESLPLEKNSSRTIHVLGFSEQKMMYSMGRGHESEVRVNDISVSRCHAKIKYHPEGIFIEDNRSKFGTLVLLKEQFPLDKDHTYAF
jgi:FHA domain